MSNTRYCRICEQRKKRIEFGLAYCVICEKNYERPDLLKHNPHLCTQCQTALKYRKHGQVYDVCKECHEVNIAISKMAIKNES